MRIKFIQRFIDSLKINKIQGRLSKVKYVHLMFNDKFNKPFVDFLNKNFNQEEHLILCKKFLNHDFPEGSNVIKIRTLKGLDFSGVDKLICHSLFDCELINYLYDNRNILKEKAYWIIWGGDLYGAKRDEINDFVRENFKMYLPVTVGDFDIINKKYNIKNQNFLKFNYYLPVNFSLFKNLKKPKHSYTQIMINNSCDESTLEILDTLARFKDKNIKITTILSYGNMQYKDMIIKKGQELFGNKFEYIDEFLTPKKYAEFFINNDILIMAQNRQQGLGNIIIALFLKIKVFIKRDVVTYEDLIKQNINVYDTYDIKNLAFEDFIKIDSKSTTTTKEKITDLYSDESIRISWEKLFEAEV